MSKRRPKDIVSYNMSRIRSTNTQLERQLEEILRKTGLNPVRYYNVIGKPDFALPELKIAFFADSDFWHGFNWQKANEDIKTNRAFWIKKIERNIERDHEVSVSLRKLGWQVVRFWEHEIVHDPEGCLKKITAAIKSRQGGE